MRCRRRRGGRARRKGGRASAPAARPQASALPTQRGGCPPTRPDPSGGRHTGEGLKNPAICGSIVTQWQTGSESVKFTGNGRLDETLHLRRNCCLCTANPCTALVCRNSVNTTAHPHLPVGRAWARVVLPQPLLPTSATLPAGPGGGGCTDQEQPTATITAHNEKSTPTVLPTSKEPGRITEKKVR